MQVGPALDALSALTFEKISDIEANMNNDVISFPDALEMRQ